MFHLLHVLILASPPLAKLFYVWSFQILNCDSGDTPSWGLVNASLFQQL